MQGVGRAFGAVTFSILVGAGAIYGIPFARDAGVLPPVSEAPLSSSLASAEAGQSTPFDIYMEGTAGLENAAVPINEICGFGDRLVPGGVQFQLIGDQPGQFSILRAREGELAVVERFTAPADQLHAFSEFTDLHVQNIGRFNARNFVLSESGDVTNSFAMFNAVREVVTCENAQAATIALNTLFQTRGSDVDKVRAGIRDFIVGGAWDARERRDDLVAACTSQQDLAELPEGRRILVGARLNRQGAYGEDVVHDMSGESLAGAPTPILNIQIAQVDSGGMSATLESYSVPAADWSFLPETSNGFGPFFRFNAVEAYSFSVEPDGSRSHSVFGGTSDGVDIPCADVEAGRVRIEALRDELRSQ